MSKRYPTTRLNRVVGNRDISLRWALLMGFLKVPCLGVVFNIELIKKLPGSVKEADRFFRAQETS